MIKTYIVVLRHADERYRLKTCEVTTSRGPDAAAEFALQDNRGERWRVESVEEKE